MNMGISTQSRMNVHTKKKIICWDKANANCIAVMLTQLVKVAIKKAQQTSKKIEGTKVLILFENIAE